MTNNSIELFSGAGGLAIGLHQAGFNTLAAIETNKAACDTLQINNLLGKDCQIIQSDVRSIDYSKYLKIDLVSGGPPCQPFSLGGKHSAHEDDRDMFPEAVRAIRELQPKAFIFENVKGLLRKSFTDYFEYILLQLQYPSVQKKEGESWEQHRSQLDQYHIEPDKKGLNYNVTFKLLNSADYGVPQKRERVFIVGFRNDLNIHWTFPEATHSEDALLWHQLVTKEYWQDHGLLVPQQSVKEEAKKKFLLKKFGMFAPVQKPWVTIRDALNDLPQPYIDEDNQKFHNHVFRGGARSYPGHTGSHIDSPSKTLKAGVHGVPGGENMIRYDESTFRYFTVRESARIQTFPDEYKLTGSWTEAMRQLGNAVPVKLAEIIGRSVLKEIK